MSARQRYRTAAAFRAALEQRLRTEAQLSRVPLNRLRKEAAFNRLLVRLRRVAPDTWALKGGLALIARVGVELRGTRDVDANWRATHEELEEALSAVNGIDMEDWFTCEIGDARPLMGEGESGALRYGVILTLDGRVFEQLSLDVNVVSPQDPRPLELVTLQRNAFGFVGEPAAEIPMVTPAQQLAEKLHAYTRLYEAEPSSRAKDLFDMLVIASQVQLPTGASLTNAIRQTFDIRATGWPPDFPNAPQDWAEPWRGFIADYPLPWGDLNAAFEALHLFWEPILNGVAADSDACWRPDSWSWT